MQVSAMITSRIHPTLTTIAQSSAWYQKYNFQFSALRYVNTRSTDQRKKSLESRLSAIETAQKVDDLIGPSIT